MALLITCHLHWLLAIVLGVSIWYNTVLACQLRSKSLLYMNPLLRLVRSPARAIGRMSWKTSPSNRSAAAVPHKQYDSIDTVLIGYWKCQSNCSAFTSTLFAQQTAFGRGVLLRDEAWKAFNDAEDEEASQLTGQLSDDHAVHANLPPSYICQVWTNTATWSHLAKVWLDNVERKPLPDAWEVADLYAYDAPPILAWKDVRFLPSHLWEHDPTVTGAVEWMLTEDGPRRISDDGGIRWRVGDAPLFRVKCAAQGAALSEATWDDADHQTFRRASELAKRRVVAVGDLHGDYANTLNVFRMAGIIDENNRWAGQNNTVFVQTGDIVDRGHDTIKLYALMERLKREAVQAGGRVVQILGNHELMNLSGDYRFITYGDLVSFGSFAARYRAWSADGFIGRRLYQLHLVHRVGSSVFAHGGISEEWANEGVHKTNQITTQELPPYVAEQDPYKRYFGWPIFADDGPAWHREFALGNEAVICPSLRRVLRRLKVERMIVGHTWQETGRVLSRCNGRFFVIDVGISAAYGGVQGALEVFPDGSVNAIYPDQRVKLV